MKECLIIKICFENSSRSKLRVHLILVVLDRKVKYKGFLKVIDNRSSGQAIYQGNSAIKTSKMKDRS